MLLYVLLGCKNNEMKILNSIGGKFRSESHRREFDNLNEEDLKIAQENVKKKAEKSRGGYHGRPKYGGMVGGNHSIWDLPYDLDRPRLPNSSFHIGGKPYSEYETIKEEPEEYNLEELVDKNLGCWCYPDKCHGDILFKLLKEL